jgi:hypothetical protein
MNEGNWGMYMREFFIYIIVKLCITIFFSCLNFQRKLEIRNLQVSCVRREQLMQMGEVGCFPFGGM